MGFAALHSERRLIKANGAGHCMDSVWALIRVCDHMGLVCNTVLGFTNPGDLTLSKNTQNKHH